MKGLRINFSREYFLVLLPLFFVFHGYIQNLEAMKPMEAILLLGKYLLVALLIFATTYLLFRKRKKAAIFTFCILFFHFFFGAFQDALKSIAGNFFISQYVFILSASLLGFIVLVLYLRKTKRSFGYTSRYLNVMLLLLILIDVPKFIQVASHKNALPALVDARVCDTCSKPDIYLIIADEYADSSSLRDALGYNNGAFQSALRNRGFHIVQSVSNYNFTPFAMASLLQMNYVQDIEGRNSSLADKNKCYRLINKSSLWTFFKQNGYEIKNHSIFNLANIPTKAPQNYILIGTDMIESQTFLSRLNKDLRYHLAMTFKIASEINRIAYFVNRCNQLLLGGLIEETKTTSTKPKFVYTHLFMPHYPYYFDKNGNPNPLESLREGEQVNAKNYLGYLQYCNTIFLETIDRILKASKQPPVIIFMSDHGFREFDTGFEENKPFYYKNLNAVLLPNGDYSKFYDGISSVNQFRVLLNSSFGQKLPLLKDSTILLYE